MARYDRTDLGAYSLGLLDAEASAVVERHLETCAECRDEVREFSDVRKFLDFLRPGGKGPTAE
jgi:anti-sigma factor RsiW